MYQLYTHRAAIDPNLPFKADVQPDTPLFFYSRSGGASGVTFDATFSDDFSFTVNGLGSAPAGSLLVYHVGSQAPQALSSGAIAFSDGNTIVTRFPLEGNGLGLFQGAVVIPEGVVTAFMAFRGVPGDAVGQVRVCDREIIPYQPLKG